MGKAPTPLIDRRPAPLEASSTIRFLGQRTLVEFVHELITVDSVDRVAVARNHASKAAPLGNPLRSLVVRCGGQSDLRDPELPEGPGREQANGGRCEASPPSDGKQPVADEIRSTCRPRDLSARSCRRTSRRAHRSTGSASLAPTAPRSAPGRPAPSPWAARSSGSRRGRASRRRLPASHMAPWGAAARDRPKASARARANRSTAAPADQSTFNGESSRGLHVCPFSDAQSFSPRESPVSLPPRCVR